MLEDAKEHGGHKCALHDIVITKLQTDMTWVIHALDTQNKHLWGITLGIVLIMIKVIMFP